MIPNIISETTVKDYIDLASGYGWRAQEGDVRVIKANTNSLTTTYHLSIKTHSQSHIYHNFATLVHGK